MPMTTTERLAKLLARCVSVVVSVNDHKVHYQSAADAIATDRDADIGVFKDVPDDVLARMRATDKIVCVTVYPDTPVGFYDICHYDFDEAIRQAYKAVFGKEGA